MLIHLLDFSCYPRYRLHKYKAEIFSNTFHNTTANTCFIKHFIALNAIPKLLADGAVWR